MNILIIKVEEKSIKELECYHQINKSQKIINKSVFFFNILTQTEHGHAKSCIRQNGNGLCDYGRHFYMPPAKGEKKKEICKI